ncbi:hypothetical protein BO71DRAFT_235074 [Aspergillus ellipticus CBS 707.79]|uniref:Uncharacterized protein n=1 Tax=Aspergillus ellipticus CBS 707.79 TaxID=1448320 RepID=A0A319DRZ3_9EURO|nr:hypothetical protein BO71DRAFT_235074 [Aspergillus ellipticus CBS 707.79]
MDSAQKTTDFLRRLEQVLLTFGSRDPAPLNYLQSQRLQKWKALLSGPTLAKSRTQKHIQRYARQFASKIFKIAGRETLYLCMTEYSVSGLPKIKYSGFYSAIEEWGQSVRFPELLTKKTSEFWETIDILRGEVRAPEGQSYSDNSSPGRRLSYEGNFSPVRSNSGNL